MPDTTASAGVHELYSRILGNPQANVERAVSNFVHEFETKRNSLPDKNGIPLPMLKETPARLKEAKGALDAGLESSCEKAKTALERLQLTQQSIAESSQKKDKAANATQMAKEAFQKDITEARDAFDQEMALRHADVVKQYVGDFVQQIDHY